MRTLRFLLEKEFLQIFRDKAILKMMLAMPILQLLVLPWAADYEIKHIQLTVVDHDQSSYSSELTRKILSSGFFELSENAASYAEAMTRVEKSETDIILEIPNGFGNNLVRDNHQQVFIAANAIDGTKALIGSSYLSSILQDFNQSIRMEWAQPVANQNISQIEISTINWYNPIMNYQFFMVPGILVFLITLVGSVMCALNIVKEKEVGTIEQINVTPVRKHIFIIGKLLPFWIIGVIIFSIGMLISRFVYGIVPLGNIGVVYIFLAVYLVAILGFGLLLSTYSSTQQQALSLSFFFILIFNLLSGLFTPVASMPEWAQVIAHFNPMTYFIEVMRMVILKGSTFSDIKIQLLIVIGFAVVFNGWAIWNYKKAE